MFTSIFNTVLGDMHSKFQMVVLSNHMATTMQNTDPNIKYFFEYFFDFDEILGEKPRRS